MIQCVHTTMSILIFCLIDRQTSEDVAIDRTINTRRVKIRKKKTKNQNLRVLELELSGNPGSINISFPYLFLKTLLYTFVCMCAKPWAGCSAGDAGLFCSDSVMKLRWNSTSQFLFVTKTAMPEVTLLILTGHVLADKMENSVLFQK